MVNVGPLEIALVAIIALIVLGPARLPEVARSVGRGMREFRSALNSAGEDDSDDELDEDEPKPDPEPEDDVEPPPLPKEPPAAAGEGDAPAPGTPEELPEGR
ncbi:MAG: sec-independent protein translocase protein TatA [Thermoleophilaceae bacterium]|jgi:TatA/E family protein of Tat protein translocase|nr:sec-independent protein translocase protein TatA [Thermoleophilaceae bacterium]